MATLQCYRAPRTSMYAPSARRSTATLDGADDVGNRDRSDGELGVDAKREQRCQQASDAEAGDGSDATGKDADDRNEQCE